MKIRVLMFAALAARVGQDEVSLDLPDGSEVKDAIGRLSEELELFDAEQAGLAFAVNMEYVGVGQVLNDGDELALIPPVSGG